MFTPHTPRPTLRRTAVAIGLAAATIVASCGGSDSSSKPASSAPASESTDASTPTDSAAPDTTAGGGDSGASIELLDHLIVDGQAYDVCAPLTAVAEAIGGAATFARADAPVEFERTAGELVLGWDRKEGTLSCFYDLTSQAVQSEITVATDELLQYSLNDPAATAASRSQQLRDANAASGFASIVDLPGVGDSAWINFLNGRFVAVQGDLLVSVVSEEAMTECGLSPDMADPCQQPLITKYTSALQQVLDIVTSTIEAGGTPVTVPGSIPADELMVTVDGAEHDLCAALATAGSAANPGVAYDSVYAGTQGCLLNPVDGELQYEARLQVGFEAGADALLDAAFAELKTQWDPTHDIAGLGTAAFADDYGSTAVRLPGLTLQVGSEPGTDSAALARAIVQALAA